MNLLQWYDWVVIAVIANALSTLLLLLAFGGLPIWGIMLCSALVSLVWNSWNNYEKWRSKNDFNGFGDLS